MEDRIEIVYNATGTILLVLEETAIELSREEAENVFVDLGHALKDQDQMWEDEIKNPAKTE